MNLFFWYKQAKTYFSFHIHFEQVSIKKFHLASSKLLKNIHSKRYNMKSDLVLVMHAQKDFN